MAQAKRNATLESRSARKKLLERREPHWVVIDPKRAIGYRKGRKGGTWIARIYDPTAAEKKKRYESLGGADDHVDANGHDILSFQQAQEKARAWFDRCTEEAKAISAGEALPKGPFTVNNALDLYFQDCERRGVKGLSRDLDRATAWIRPELGELEVANLRRHRLEAWLQQIAESPKRVRTANPDKPKPKPRAFKVPRVAKPTPEPPKPPTTDEEKRARKDSANRVLTTLKAALNHALDRRRVVSGEAWMAVKPYRGTTSARVRFLNATEQVRLVNACPEDFRQLVRGALLTGARYGELSQLRVRDFNDQAGTVFVSELISKNGKSRHIVLTEDGRILFRQMALGKGHDDLVFQRKVERRKRESLGSAWGHGDAHRLMALAFETAGLEELTFHELRHSYASMLINAGCPLPYVAAQLGHTDTRMVEKHYGHLAPSAMADAIRAALPSLGLVATENVAALKVQGA